MVTRKDTKFRSNGHLLTVPLFAERSQEFKKPLDKVLFTMDGKNPTHPETGATLINARDSFIELEDITGHKWAKTYLESYEHFKRFVGATWFREEMENWVEEIGVIQKARALQVVQDLLLDAEAPEGTRLSAAKYLAEKGWDKKVNSKGRPSKELIKGELKKAVRKATDLENDAERIGLKVVK